MADELVKPTSCETERGMTRSELVGPQFCANDISEAFRAYAVDPMSYQSQVQYVRMNEGVVKSMNKYVKLSINATVAVADRLVRIGAVGLTGEYLLFNVPAGAADFADITDQYGINVRKTQGYSQLVRDKEMMITQWRMISSSTNQLAVSVLFNTINPDMTINPQEIDIAATFAKSDQRQDLVIAYGVWAINGNHYFEFTALMGERADVILEVGAIRNVGGYVKM